MHTVLIIGGYGFFGKRIAASLAASNLAKNSRLKILIAGRHREPAIAAASALGLSSEQGIGIDAHDQDFSKTLASLKVDTVLHTAGPFQTQNYSVARAAIEAGCNYLDLADGREFVVGIAELDQLARERGVSVISGASSVPSLSSAVVDRYAPLFKRIDSIQFGIASGARAPGIATVKGIFGYCGKPIRRKENNAWVTTHGWMDLKRHRFPAPIGARFLGSCEIPDLDLFPIRYPTVHTVQFHAGFASDIGHLVVWSLAGLVKLGALPSLKPLASTFSTLSRWIEPLVSDKGAMFVTITGIDTNGEPLQKNWNIVASQNHGPHIPCGASIALINKLANGVVLPKGAMPCIGLLSVEEYLASVSDLDIREVVA